jgi:hypothetical protein
VRSMSRSYQSIRPRPQMYLLAQCTSIELCQKPHTRSQAPAESRQNTEKYRSSNGAFVWFSSHVSKVQSVFTGFAIEGDSESMRIHDALCLVTANLHRASSVIRLEILMSVFLIIAKRFIRHRLKA